MSAPPPGEGGEEGFADEGDYGPYSVRLWNGGKKRDQRADVSYNDTMMRLALPGRCLASDRATERPRAREDSAILSAIA